MRSRLRRREGSRHYIALVAGLSVLLLLGYGASRGIHPTTSLGRVGKSMVGMLGYELPFTVFVPAESFLNQVLNRSEADSSKLSEQQEVVLSRLLSFAAVPVHILSSSLQPGGEVQAESMSGYSLFVTKDKQRGLLVNGLNCEAVDMKNGSLVVHVVHGVLMDIDFRNSVTGPGLAFQS